MKKEKSGPEKSWIWTLVLKKCWYFVTVVLKSASAAIWLCVLICILGPNTAIIVVKFVLIFSRELKSRDFLSWHLSGLWYRWFDKQSDDWWHSQSCISCSIVHFISCLPSVCFDVCEAQVSKIGVIVVGMVKPKRLQESISTAVHCQAALHTVHILMTCILFSALPQCKNILYMSGYFPSVSFCTCHFCKDSFIWVTVITMPPFNNWSADSSDYPAAEGQSELRHLDSFVAVTSRIM